jgi:signal transduction histidine kinase/ActR/RegA family two-component response regulator
MLSKNRMKRKSLHFNINLAILLACVIMALILGAIFFPFERVRHQNRLEDIRILMTAVYRQKKEDLANEIFAHQLLGLKNSLETMKSVNGIAMLSAFDLDGRVIVSTGLTAQSPLAFEQRKALEHEPLFAVSQVGHGSYATYTTLIQVVGEPIGYLKIYYDLGPMEKESLFALAIFFALLLLTLCTTAGLLNFMLRRTVIEPALKLRDAITRLRGGRLGEQVALDKQDEIGEIAQAFNEMSTRLASQHEELVQAIEAKGSYAARLEESNRALEDLNSRLEEMVEGRTIELSRSYDKLRKEINERLQAERDKKELQERLSRSQKMEALGLLAGGVAHDLNNVLSGIVSYPDLLLMDLPADHPMVRPIQTIRASGQKAAAIVQDLLTLARRGVTHPVVLNLNGDIIADYLSSPEFDKLKTYHANVTVEARLSPDLMNITGSIVHLRKTVMNLISNAAEAQPDGGAVIISTRNQYIDQPLKGYETIAEGDYAVLEVRDQGTGIALEDLNRIFEPFYTKKVMGRSGTGLGMAVVWGTVQDHHGYIQVDSTPGQGTVFSLYFPVTREARQGTTPTPVLADYFGSGEKVLVIDDIKEQREIASAILTRLNYRVASADSGQAAIDYVRQHPVDVLVLDMIMDPGLDGLDTYRRVIELYPGQKAVIASGFAENERVREVLGLGAGRYIKKPYTLEKIGLALRQVLGAKQN